MADFNLLVDAVTSLADAVQKKGSLVQQGTVGAVYASGSLTVVDDTNRRWAVDPVTDEDIEAGHRVWIAIAEDGSRVVLGLVK